MMPIWPRRRPVVPAQVRALQVEVTSLRARIAREVDANTALRAERDTLRHLLTQSGQPGYSDRGYLLDRICQLETDNAKLWRDLDSREELLRERETVKRLEAEVHRLTMASVDQDRPVRLRLSEAAT